jgi:hypothetical protein
VTTFDRSVGSLSNAQTAALSSTAVERPNQLRRILGMPDLVLMIVGTCRFAGSWKFRRGCVNGLAGGRSSFAARRADLRRT